MDVIIGFLLGLFIGAAGGFFICALAIAAGSNNNSDEEQIEWLNERKEDFYDDGK